MNPLSVLPDSVKERLRRRAGAVTVEARLENLRTAGFAPRQIIDAGAFRGDWSILAHRVFPDAALLLIEPQPHLREPLAEICAQIPGTRHRAALLGRSAGSARFVLQHTNSRIVGPGYVAESGEELLDLPISPLHAIAAEEGFLGVDFIKLDLQGHELEALAGAGELFGRTEVIQTEVSWLQIGDVPLAADVIGAMSARGYRLYDVFGFNYRPRDRALWQTDFIFVRTDSKLLASRSWA